MSKPHSLFSSSNICNWDMMNAATLLAEKGFIRSFGRTLRIVGVKELLPALRYKYCAVALVQ